MHQGSGTRGRGPSPSGRGWHREIPRTPCNPPPPALPHGGDHHFDKKASEILRAEPAKENLFWIMLELPQF